MSERVAMMDAEAAGEPWFNHADGSFTVFHVCPMCESDLVEGECVICDWRPSGSTIGRVVNVRNAKFDVYIGRAGKGQSGYFGNPFEIGPDGDREEVIERFREWAEARMYRDPEYRRRVASLYTSVLGCFCAPHLCHGNVLLDLAAREMYVMECPF